MNRIELGSGSYRKGSDYINALKAWEGFIKKCLIKIERTRISSNRRRNNIGTNTKIWNDREKSFSIRKIRKIVEFDKFWISCLADCHWIFFHLPAYWLVCLAYIHMIITGPQTAHHYIDRSFDRSMKIIDWKYQQPKQKTFDYLLLSV